MSFGNIEKVLKLLSVENPAPVVKVGSQYFRTAAEFKLDKERIDFLINQRISEWQEMLIYLQHDKCLMTFLRNSLDDDINLSCNNCSNCKPDYRLSSVIGTQYFKAATKFLKHGEEPLILRKQVASNSFPVYGFRGNIPPLFQGEEGRVLSRWGDAGWGYLVNTCKYNNYFTDDLVDASIELILERWVPNPFPEWVCCVPSLRHLNLVPDFAQRVANKLGIPFINCINKVKINSPQKMMNNRFQQCHNLDGVFEINGIVRNSPVLLIDDIVDSGWTLSIISALLKRAGAGPVYPMALASTSTGN